MLINQLTPYTCALACWSHFMLEQGIMIDDSDILKNHRDICIHVESHCYGSIDKAAFKKLARRYLWVAEDFSPATTEEIRSKTANQGDAVFVFLMEYRGSAHISRIVPSPADTIQFATSCFPYSDIVDATMDMIVKEWGGEFVYCTRFPVDPA